MEFQNGTVKLSYTDETLYANISGEIDHHSARTIREAIDSALLSYSPEALVMNVSAISFMDSSGLGLVLGRYSKASEAGIAFTVTGVNSRVERMFDMAGLERIINYKSKENKK